MRTPSTPTTQTTPIAASRMGRRLTAPFERGADTLPLRLLPAGSSQSTVDDYGFDDHVARFDAEPQPRYVLATTRDIDVDTTVRLDYDEPGAPSGFTVVTVPAGSVAGTSFLLEAPVSATARLTLLTMGTAPFDNRPELCWTLTVLLGTTAKLLWAVGAERDQLRGHAVRTLAQRHLPSATGLSLDLLGHDLGVPRFPPQPYGFDADTVALYHLGDAAGDVPPVADATAAFPGRHGGFPGTFAGAVQLGVAGRYGQAMGFRAAGAAVRVPTDAAFDIDAEGEFTVECFVRPDPEADGPVLSRHPAPDGDGPGWVLRIGKFDAGLDRDVRFSISDGTTMIDLYACVSLPTDRFTHLAASFDRLTGRVTLYVDGAAKDFRFRFPLGAVVNTADLLIGAAGGGFRGVVDEVRISSAARVGFAPALGEDDEHYRRRLSLFRRWTLPTPANLTAVLNQLVGPIGGRPDPLVVDDTNATLVRGTRLVHIRPESLLPGESIDAAGRRGTAEATVVGTAAEEDTFDPVYLLRYDNEDVDFGPPPPRTLDPGEHPPDPHRVQLGVAQCLDRLFTLAGAAAAQPGRLLIDSAYDPRANDLRATGRAVLLGHDSLTLGKLAALAHRAGFGFVGYRAAAGRIYAATAPGDYFAIDLAPAAAGPTDLDVGARTATLSLRPAPPPDAFLRWLLVPTAGGARATLTPAGNPGSPHRTATLEATAAGPLIVKVDVTRGRHTVSATRALRAGLTDLPEGGKIAADGTTGVPASIVDRPDAFFDRAFLTDHSDPRVDYSSPAAHKTQPAVAELLDALLAELARRGVGGRLAVSVPDPAPAKGPAAEGRQLLLRHSVLTPGALASSAFAVGFGHLEHRGADLVVTQAPGQLVKVRGPAKIDRGAVIELEEGDVVDLTATPSSDDLHNGGLTGQVPGEGPRLGWASGTFDNAAITLTSSTRPTITLQAGSAGAAWVQASYLVGGKPAPYTFQVRLRPDLDVPDTVITKDQFDLIMNVLNVLHPVGVEVSTAAIRAHVVEVRGDLSQANPEFTYPKFRVRGPLPRQARKDTAHG